MPCRERRPLWYLFLFGLLPLLAGAVFYYLFCPEVFFVRFVRGITGYAQTSEANSFPAGSGLWSLLRNHLADYLWAQAITAAVLFVSVSAHRDIKRDFCLCLLGVTVMELIQLDRRVLMTFDLLDIIVQLFGAYTAFLASRLIKHNKE